MSSSVEKKKYYKKFVCVKRILYYTVKAMLHEAIFLATCNATFVALQVARKKFTCNTTFCNCNCSVASCKKSIEQPWTTLCQSVGSHQMQSAPVVFVCLEEAYKRGGHEYPRAPLATSRYLWKLACIVKCMRKSLHQRACIIKLQKHYLLTFVKEPLSKYKFGARGGVRGICNGTSFLFECSADSSAAFI